jgi:hypothetical protein
MKAIIHLLLITIIKQYYSVLQNNENKVKNIILKRTSIESNYKYLINKTNVTFNENNFIFLKGLTSKQIEEHTSYIRDLEVLTNNQKNIDKSIQKQINGIIKQTILEVKDLIKILLKEWKSIMDLLSNDKNPRVDYIIDISKDFISKNSYVIITSKYAQDNEALDSLKSIADQLKVIVIKAYKMSKDQEKKKILVDILNNLEVRLYMIKTQKDELNIKNKSHKILPLSINELDLDSAAKLINDFNIRLLEDIKRYGNSQQPKTIQDAASKEIMNNLNKELEKKLGNIIEKDIGEDFPDDVTLKLRKIRYFYDFIDEYYKKYTNITSYFGKITNEEFDIIKNYTIKNINIVIFSFKYIYYYDLQSETQKNQNSLMNYENIFCSFNDINEIEMKIRNKNFTFQFEKLTNMISSTIVMSTKSISLDSTINKNLTSNLDYMTKNLEKTIEEINNKTRINNTDVYEIFTIGERLNGEIFKMQLTENFLLLDKIKLYNFNKLILRFDLFNQIMNDYRSSFIIENTINVIFF